MRKCLLFTCMLFSLAGVFAQKGIVITKNKDQKSYDVSYRNRLLTSFRYDDSIMKPVLFPVNTINGVTVTRGFPLEPRAGERNDHPHHIGIWLNYESVNGIDFWNNSTAIPAERKSHYGRIEHKEAKLNGNELVSTASWKTYDGRIFLHEKSTYQFFVKGNDFIIERETQLTAVDSAVLFKDVKDGMLAIRVARELELPSKEPSEYVDDKGNITRVDPSGGKVTGNYLNSEGSTGDAVWSSKGNWCLLHGRKDGKDITIAMIDHPSNVGYPSYWHARGYGLFAMNPLGRKIFSNGSEELNFKLEKGQTTRFRHRIIIHEGPVLSAEAMNKSAEDFSKKSW